MGLCVQSDPPVANGAKGRPLRMFFRSSVVVMLLVFLFQVRQRINGRYGKRR
jgi:hypothetical protein